MTQQDIQSTVHAKLAQLEAMLIVTHGEVGEAFSLLSDEVRDNYLCACRSLATEIRDLTRGLP